VRREREHAAFALIVGAHQKDDVFDRDDEEQRPQGEAEYAEDFVGNQSVGRGLAQRFAECVERAGADIAEHHADRADGQGQHC
jgi:hypothetical protein